MSVSRPHYPDTLAAGQRIGPFVLLAPLGSGGSGRIWAVARVGQLGFSKRMVLKVMRNDKLSSESARERFDREACLGGRLSHPNVRAVHDLGSHEGRPFMALSWVDASLEELLEHAPGHTLDADVACWIAMQCCSALSAAHEYVDHGGVARPIVHRDVSPGNILLTAEGHALLADLTAPAAEASPRAEAGTRFFGSLGYAAPEALRLEPCDARADLFSLGAVLFEALAGAPAFGGDDERSVMFQILEGLPLDLARRAPSVPEELAAVVQRCLERRAENRFQSARELREALARCSAQRSAFSLEQQAARSVRDVLGARIREREEALHRAYQRIAPSPFEHTDTLPIQGAGAASASQRASDPSSPGLDLSRSAAGMAISEPRPGRRRRALWVAAALALLLGLYGSISSRWRGVRSTGAASAAGSAAALSDEPPAVPSARPPASAPPTAATASAPPSVEAAALRPSPQPNASSAEPAPAGRSPPPPSGTKSARKNDAPPPQGGGERRAPASRTPGAIADAERAPQPSRALPGLDRESPYRRKAAPVPRERGR